MASFGSFPFQFPFLMLFFFLMSHNIGSTQAFVAHQFSTNMRISTISAAPALLPDSNPYPPLSSPAPALSPDITPLFPTPGADTFPPSESSLPTIPSSPSPPNPDDALSSPGPDGLAFPPSGLLPASSVAPNSPPLMSLRLILSFVVFGLVLQLSAM